MRTFLLTAILLVASNAGTARAGTENYYGGWRFNLTPTLIAQGEEYGLGGGVDPEVRFAFGLAGAFFSLGARAGGYYARDLFGVTAMPTARLTLPVGSMELYGSVGMGRGWIPKSRSSEAAEMYRAGFHYHFSSSFGLGAEATYQRIVHTNFQFLSLGSMLSFGF